LHVRDLFIALFFILFVLSVMFCTSVGIDVSLFCLLIFCWNLLGD
jgi:hypothetical protein